MKTSNTGERLRKLISDRHLRQVDILSLAQPYCAKYGVKLGRNDLSQYVNGKVEPGQEKLTILGLALNVSEAWLMGYDVSPSRSFSSSSTIPNVIPVPQMRSIPLLGTIACGVPLLAEENAEGFLAMPGEVHADFCLRCKGDSMINARIFDGDIVYIRQQETVETGEIAAVLIENEATLKRVRIFDDHISLEPENPQYRPIVLWNEEMNSVRILGKAVAFTSAIR